MNENCQAQAKTVKEEARILFEQMEKIISKVVKTLAVIMAILLSIMLKKCK